jgi:hypothetical protein
VLCELEHCNGGKSKRWLKVQVFLYTQLQYLQVRRLVGSLASWNEFEVNNTLDIEESDKNCLRVWFRHVSFHGSCGCPLVPLQIL